MRSNLKVTFSQDCTKNEPVIGQLCYGTIVKDVPNGNDCLYMKVDKCKSDSANRPLVQWSPGNCVILNLRYGTLREIPGKTKVTPISPELRVSLLPGHRYNEVLKP